MTHMLGAVAPLAVLLEGGYNLRATAAGCEAVLRVLLGQKVPAFSRPAVPCTAGLMAIQQVIKQQVRVQSKNKDVQYNMLIGHLTRVLAVMGCTTVLDNLRLVAYILYSSSGAALAGGMPYYTSSSMSVIKVYTDAS